MASSLPEFMLKFSQCHIFSYGGIKLIFLCEANFYFTGCFTWCFTFPKNHMIFTCTSHAFHRVAPSSEYPCRNVFNVIEATEGKK